MSLIRYIVSAVFIVGSVIFIVGGIGQSLMCQVLTPFPGADSQILNITP
jgi:hypothetical protein